MKVTEISKRGQIMNAQDKQELEYYWNFRWEDLTDEQKERFFILTSKENEDAPSEADQACLVIGAKVRQRVRELGNFVIPNERAKLSVVLSDENADMEEIARVSSALTKAQHELDVLKKFITE